MYRWVLIAHSAWRWVVVIAGFATVFSAALRLSMPQPAPPSDRRLGRFFSIAVDIQVLMGAALYLTLSPLTTIVVSSANTRLPGGSQAHYFAATHPIVMIAAFIAVHIASALVSRAKSDAARERRVVLFYGATLLIILFGIPWWRPWLRF